VKIGNGGARGGVGTGEGARSGRGRRNYIPVRPRRICGRVRTQFRERQPEEDLKTMLKYAVQREQMADIAVESLSGGAVTKHRFWIIPAIFVVSAAAVLAAAFIMISTGRSRKESGNCERKLHD